MATQPPPGPSRSPGDPLLGAPVALVPAPAPRPNDPLLGATVAGKFLIEADLGKGGAGKVYVATQLALQRRVALKILRPELDADGDERFAERFFREASLAGALQHPNVVTVHDYGRSPDGLCYIAMELLDGRSLKDLMKDGPLEPERALSIFEQVGRGLRAAHRAGLVHRDVKPGNVLVVPGEDGAEVAKLLDFGLVKSEAAEVTEITRDGSFLGTPHYAAPEQVRGEEADARADIYAFGVMLFRALTGKLPYASKNAMAIALAHVREPIPRMAERAPDVRVPAPLEELVRRCMAKDRDERFPDMDSLLQALARLRQEVGGAPRPLPPEPPAAPAAPAAPRAPSRLGPGLLLGGGAVAGLVGLGLGGLALFGLRGPPLPAPPPAPLAVTAPALAEDTVSVTVLTDPAGARVLADGVEVGTTPFVGPLALVEGGPPPVRVELAGYAAQDLALEPGAGGLRAEVSLAPLPTDPAPAPPAAEPAPRPAAAPSPSPRPSPAPAGGPAPTPAPAAASAAAPAPAPAPRPAAGGGAQVVDGVRFTAAEATAALRFANSASKDDLVAAGIAPAQATYVLKGRPYADLAAFGAAYGVGPKTVQAVARAVAR